jgi:hypothetical protein
VVQTRMALRPYKNLVGEYLIACRHNKHSQICYDSEGGILVLKQNGCHPTDRPFYQPMPPHESVSLRDEVHDGLIGDYDVRYLTYSGQWQFKFSDIRDARWFLLRFMDG